MAGIFNTLEISGSGMSVQRRKMNVVAENIANAETTSTDEGGPYQRKILNVTASSERQPFRTILRDTEAQLACTNSRHIRTHQAGVNGYGTVNKAEAETVQDANAVRLIYDPDHPDANDEGYVSMPDIEIINEMVDMISANRAYEANAMAISSTKEMMKSALDI